MISIFRTRDSRKRLEFHKSSVSFLFSFSSFFCARYTRNTRTSAQTLVRNRAVYLVCFVLRIGVAQFLSLAFCKKKIRAPNSCLSAEEKSRDRCPRCSACTFIFKHSLPAFQTYYAQYPPRALNFVASSSSLTRSFLLCLFFLPSFSPSSFSSIITLPFILPASRTHSSSILYIDFFFGAFCYQKDIFQMFFFLRNSLAFAPVHIRNRFSCTFSRVGVYTLALISRVTVTLESINFVSNHDASQAFLLASVSPSPIIAASSSRAFCRLSAVAKAVAPRNFHPFPIREDTAKNDCSCIDPRIGRVLLIVFLFSLLLGTGISLACMYCTRVLSFRVQYGYCTSDAQTRDNCFAKKTTGCASERWPHR